MTATTDGVIITLDGAPVTLRYSLGAAKRINAFFGNFGVAFHRVGKFDFEAFPPIVAAALNKEIKDVEESVFLAGMDSLYKDLGEYLQWMSNGGRQPAPLAADTPADSGNA